ncbi:MAG: MarC family protein [Hyphomicrobiales bacterium]
MELFDNLFHDLTTLWVVIDPVGTLPIFLAATVGMSAAQARGTAIRAVIVAFIILLFFVVAGQLLLTSMDVRLESFEIAGGIVLFLFALTMVFGEPKSEKEEAALSTSPSDPAIYPLAIPSIAGPGAMLAAVTLTDNSKFNMMEQAETVFQIAVVLALTLVLLFAASRIVKLIGTAGVNIVSRVMGLILASVAVDTIVNAVRILWPSGGAG